MTPALLITFTYLLAVYLLGGHLKRARKSQTRAVRPEDYNNA